MASLIPNIRILQIGGVPNPARRFQTQINSGQMPRTKNPFYYLSGSISATQKRRRKQNGR